MAKDPALTSTKPSTDAAAATVEAVGEMANMARTKTCLHQWHRKLGHRDVAAVKKLAAEKLAEGIDIGSCAQTPVICDCCIRGKMATLAYKPSKTRRKKPLDLLHSDVCGPMPTTSPSGNRYILTIVDDFSRFCIVMLLKAKSEVAEALRTCFTMLENQFERKVKVLRTDNGREYINKDVIDYCREKGIRRQLTVVHTPEQNGVAEAKPISHRDVEMHVPRLGTPCKVLGGGCADCGLSTESIAEPCSEEDSI